MILALTPPASLYVSRPILAEYEEVISRPELRITPSERRDLMALITARGRHVAPKRTLSACRDPDDNMFVECAEEARADYLVTGNRKHFPAYWKNTKVINGREFLEIVGPHLPV